jgi:hypothetical protein
MANQAVDHFADTFAIAVAGLEYIRRNVVLIQRYVQAVLDFGA